MKIVWICHFSNNEIQNYLKPWKRVNEFAPWITNTIKVFEDKPGIELHIISPHKYIPWKREFILRGVYYHFFNAHIPLWGRQWPSFFKFDYLSNFWLNKHIVRNIVQKISPDVIHLQGAENVYYSSTILQFKKKYPVIVNLQRFTTNFEKPTSLILKKRVEAEKKILNSFSHFSIRTQTMEHEFRKYRPDAKLYWVRYKIPTIELVQSPEKVYDIVFFARICKDKGIEDLLSSIAITKKNYNSISVCIIGNTDNKYKNYLSNMTKELGIDENIVWINSLKTQAELHGIVSKAKICVIPTHYDIIPGTIIESMFLGLPVITYNVGSIWELNNERESLIMVEKGDITGLAKSIINLLTDKILFESIQKNARITVVNRYRNVDCYIEHLNCYNDVIKDFKAGVF